MGNETGTVSTIDSITGHVESMGEISGNVSAMNDVTGKVETGNITILNDDYIPLKNKPQIEGNELIGNKTYPELGLGDITPQEIDDILFGGF